MKGRFIVIEGGEGAGKDANIELLKRDFPGEHIVWVKDPGGTAVGDELRAITQYGESIGRETELFLFLAARAQLAHEIIIPTLQAGKHVIANRFDLSTMAYQVYGRQRHDIELLMKDISALARGEANPDCVIFLDVSPEEGLRRAALRKEKTTRFEAEALAFHTRVREGYLAHLSDYPKSVVLDASRPLEEVYAEVKKVVETELTP